MTTERAVLLLATVLAAIACRQDMHDQPKYRPLRPSAFFPDGRASRPRIEDTVARGELATAEQPPTTAALLARGRERYDVFCSPCHDRVGNGGGMIVERGFRRPPSFHLDRLREAPDTHFFAAITDGFGVMPSYAAQIPSADRWAIVAYVRALQLSQHAGLADAPPPERERLAREKD